MQAYQRRADVLNRGFGGRPFYSNALRTKESNIE
jgi:hypothetical protein